MSACSGGADDGVVGSGAHGSSLSRAALWLRLQHYVLMQTQLLHVRLSPLI